VVVTTSELGDAVNCNIAHAAGTRRDFLGFALLRANVSDNTKNNTSNGARGAKMIFPSGRSAGFKMN